MDSTPNSTEPSKRLIVGAAFAVPVIGAVVTFVLSIGLTAIVLNVFFDNADGLFVMLVFLLVWAGSFLFVSPVVAVFIARRPALGPAKWVPRSVLFSLWVPVAVIFGGTAAWFGYRAGMELIGGAFGVLVAMAMIVSAVRLADHAQLRIIWLTVAGAAMIFMLGVVLLEPSYRRTLYTADVPPMGLIDQSELDTTLPGWRLLEYEDVRRGKRWPVARAHVITASGVELELSFSPIDKSCRPDPDTCDSLGQLDDGSRVTVWRDSAMCGDPRRPSYISVDAERPEGHWSLDSSNRCGERPQPTLSELFALLNIVRPVAVAEWVDAT